ncbi:MFS transporter [Arthrobacter sp. zg-Y859]|uniref:MFS transporter n=1 Tax=Arthrobacter jinronghuae TaxID=2964609 RepID=A0ABT1NR06_9MICC|nr:MFS transporter [Arthrobacter jinronghuae]MCQ1950026.1 MFS transporter [Arthrobacter jinronghuae]UWX80168.1 MFS transporter [Arthrobacter jinronghuae]
MSSPGITVSTGSTRATFLAAYSAVTLAQMTNALPGALNGTFAAEFHTSGAGLTWIAGIFMTGVVVFELSWGLLGDLFGRRRLLYAGAGLTAVGSVLAALAPTTGAMIAAQAVGGIGAGILFPISLSMIAALTPDPRARARVIATWAGFLSLGAVISPVLSGLTSSVFTVPGSEPGDPNVFSGWRVAYYIAAGVGVLVLIAATRAKDSAAPVERRLDLPGQATLALGLIAVLYATVQAVDAGFGAAEVIAAYIAGGILLVLFVIIEQRSAQPLIHLSLFRNRAYSITGIVAVTGMFAFLAICYSTSVAVGGLALAETWKVGVLFVFIQGPAFLFIPVVGWLIHHVAPRWVLTGGFALMAVSGYWLSTFSLGTPEEFGGTSWTAFIPPLLLLGIGFALTVGSVTAVAINTVEAHNIGMASATTNLLRDLGFALGPVLGSVIAFGIGATAFAVPLAGILGGAGLPEDAVAGLSQVPPLGFLSGWPDVISQFSGSALAGGAPQPAVDGMVQSLTTLQPQIQGAAGTSLGQGFQAVYLTAGIAATVSAFLTLFISGRSSSEPSAASESKSTEADAAV